MVLGYICKEHGYQSECDVSESGERVCYECGNAVTGLSGSTRNTHRSPPEDSDWAEGDIQWDVHGYGLYFTVNAHDFEEAAERALEAYEHDDPQKINEIEPSERRYRH